MTEPMDTLVFDIETSNFFTTPGVGWDNFAAINISVVGMYSYERDAYYCAEAGEREVLEEWFGNAKRIVGFASHRYDVPVLNLLFKKWGAEANGVFDLWRKDRFDLLEEIELATSRRVSLSRLAEANLGVAKDHQGHEAIAMFAEGRMEELKAYCLKDVQLTKDLYDMLMRDRALKVPNQAGKIELLTFDAPSIQLSVL